MDRDGRQELHYRALEGDVSGIRDRLADGDDLAVADREGFTALRFAAQQSQAEAVRELLAAGAPWIRSGSETRRFGAQSSTREVRSRPWNYFSRLALILTS
jgi:ankyrin repeat protein